MATKHRPAVPPPEFAAMVLDPALRPTLLDLAEYPNEALLPPLDRTQVCEASLTPAQAFWRANGYLILERFMPEELLDRYCAVKQRVPDHMGFPSPVPYMQVPECRDLCLHKPLSQVLDSLIGAPMGLHMNLTQWTSTERNWHQDDFANPPFVSSWYAAVWIALDDIHPDSGPFEYIPGSHKWPMMRGELVRRYLRPEYRDNDQWPKFAEYVINPAVERAIAESGAEVCPFLARKGDVLVWHGRLVHRGSEPRVRGMRRKSCIGHYSALDHRPDLKDRACTEDGVPYFVFNGHEFDWEEYVAAVSAR
jgi:hypothetical protein